jgi:voltage-gated potassium channel
MRRGSVGRGLWSYLLQPPTGLRALIFVVALIAYSTAGFLFFEKPAKPELGWLDAFWWTLVTICTVGYGDYFPATMPGRVLVGIPTMLTGVGVLGYALSQVAAFLVRSETMRRKGMAMHDVTGHIVICNYPGPARLARLLQELRDRYGQPRLPVVLVDEHLTELDDHFTREDVRFVRGHPAREQALRQASVQAAARAVVLARDVRDPHSDTLNVATCLTLRTMRPDLHIVAECLDPENLELLARAGCHSVVCVMDLAPGILAHELHDPGVVGLLEELTVWGDHENNVFVAPIHLGASAKRVSDLHLWALERGATLIGLRCDQQLIVNPPPERALAAGEAAVLICRNRPEAVHLEAAPARLAGTAR